MSAGKKRSAYYTTRNKVKLIRAGTEYFTLLEQLIDSATSSIHLQFYIYDDDATGLRIGEAMKRAAERNVQVYFIADGYASRVLSNGFIAELRHAGIHFKYFEPLFKTHRFYFGRRMHHKIVVIDGKKALVGGINITNRYNDMPGRPAWLDYALYVQGAAAVQLHEICNNMWANAPVRTIPPPADTESFLKDISLKDSCSVRVRINDWVQYRNEVWRTYFDLFNHAETSITIMCSYFLPGWELLRRLGKAARRGVQIKVILAGPSDVWVAKSAERFLYSWMLKNNIEIYEYQANVLHAKIAVADGHWVTIGSYNINNISAHASMELNLDIRNKSFAQEVKKQMERIIDQDCIHITLNNYNSSEGFFKRLLQKASYFFIKILLTLFTFYFRRESKDTRQATAGKAVT